jgi:hypothetical protein
MERRVHFEAIGAFRNCRDVRLLKSEMCVKADLRQSLWLYGFTS